MVVLAGAEVPAFGGSGFFGGVSGVQPNVNMLTLTKSKAAAKRFIADLLVAKEPTGDTLGNAPLWQ